MALGNQWLWPVRHRRRRRFRVGSTCRRIMPRTAEALKNAGLVVGHDRYRGCLVPTMECRLRFNPPPLPEVPE